MSFAKQQAVWVSRSPSSLSPSVFAFSFETSVGAAFPPPTSCSHGLGQAWPEEGTQRACTGHSSCPAICHRAGLQGTRGSAAPAWTLLGEASKKAQSKEVWGPWRERSAALTSERPVLPALHATLTQKPFWNIPCIFLNLCPAWLLSQHRTPVYLRLRPAGLLSWQTSSQPCGLAREPRSPGLWSSPSLCSPDTEVSRRMLLGTIRHTPWVPKPPRALS